jgi:hypothetical protein
LAEPEHAELRTLVGPSTALARMLAPARSLLKADHAAGGPGWSDAAVANALDLRPATVRRFHCRFVTEGLAPTLARKRPDQVYERSLDGQQRPTSSPSPAAGRRRDRSGGACGSQRTSWSGWRPSGRSCTRPSVARSNRVELKP